MLEGVLKNSELQRCYWQSFSWQRWILMPVVLLSVALLILWPESRYKFNALNDAAAQAYFVIVFLWGAYQAAHAFPNEVTQNTWDNLRLSSVSPGQLTVGKLFGSTMYPWYGGLIILGIQVFAQFHQHRSLPVIAEGVAWMLGSGLLCHAVAMLCSLLPMRFQAGAERYHPAGYLIVGLIAGSLFLAVGVSVIGSHPNAHPGFMRWFQHDVPNDAWWLGTLALALLWSVWAIYRFLREALQFKNTPAVWALFVVFCTVYAAGFVTPETSFWQDAAGRLRAGAVNEAAYVAFLAGVYLAYLTLYAENLNIIRYRALWHHLQPWLRAGGPPNASLLKKPAHLLPMWTITLGWCVLMGVGFWVSTLLRGEGAGEVGLFVLTSLLFLVRDVGIFHYFTLAPHGRLPLLAATFYLGVLYMLLPGLLFALTSQVGALGWWFFPAYPMLGDPQWWTLLPALSQALLSVWLVRHRYRQINALFG